MIDSNPASWPTPVLVLYAFFLLVVLFVVPVVLGIRAAKAKGRSPHWMWFGLHPLTGWIACLWLRRAGPAQPSMRVSSVDEGRSPREVLGKSAAIDLILECIEPGHIWAVDLEPAIEELKGEGSRGSDRVAALLRDLLASRSEGIGYALYVAQGLQLTPALEEILSEIAVARPLKNGPQGRFTPEIVGGGRIGWTDATHARVTGLAKAALQRPEETVAPPAPSNESARSRAAVETGREETIAAVAQGPSHEVL